MKSYVERIRPALGFVDICVALRNSPDASYCPQNPGNSTRGNGQDSQHVEDFIKTRTDLQLVLDLNNAHKHGYPPTKKRHSGRDPKFSWIRAASQSQSDGLGSMRTDIVIIGEVVDRHDVFICRMDNLFGGAIAAWEELLEEFGIKARVA
jgi:hypothetical protein